MQKISETARGRWHGILPQLGISPKLLQNRHGPCPMCGGKDRFRFDDREGKGTWICNRCGSGDGAELVKRVKGVEYKEAARMVEGVVGTVGRRPERPERPETSRVELSRVWDAARRIKSGSAVADYLEKRGISAAKISDNLRETTDGEVMLAKVQALDGTGVNIHRTYVESGTRLLMPGKLPSGSAIRLFYPWPETTIGIAEGIETALSAFVLFNVPVWSAISASLLKKWSPPPGVEKVIIFGDNDENFTGQEAAYSLARVLKNDVEVDVKIPSIPGWDWNDVHRNNLDNR
jgi:putative DNA primase/helicase